MTKSGVNIPSREWEAYIDLWRLVEAVSGGTSAMREAGELYLPKEPLEENTQYEQRLSRSFLINYFEDAIVKIVAKPFSKPVTIEESSLKPFFDEPCGDGRTFHWCLQDFYHTAVKYGVAHALIDMPPDRAESLADQRYPTMTIIPPTALIGWKVMTGASRDRVQQIRVLETQVVEGEFGPAEEFTQVRVIEPTRWAVYREYKKEGEDSEWRIIDEGVNTLGYVPLITLNLKGTSMVCRPPLEGLAWANVAHWQSYSDQRNALRFARIGILFLRGVTREEAKEMLAVGPNRLHYTSNPSASMSYVEHSGAAMRIGAEDISKLEQQMEQLGAQPLIERTAASTATGKSIDESRHISIAQSWAWQLNQAANDIASVVAGWMNVAEVPQVTVYTDFDTSIIRSANQDSLERARTRGDVSRIDYLNQLQRYGVIPSNENLEEWNKRAEDESAFGESIIT